MAMLNNQRVSHMGGKVLAPWLPRSSCPAPRASSLRCDGHQESAPDPPALRKACRGVTRCVKNMGGPRMDSEIVTVLT